MKPELQRIAIAEACGWRNPNHEETQKLVATWWSKDRNVWWLHPDRASLVMSSSVPDYVNSLDAIHEAEMSRVDLEDGHFVTLFREHLHTILGHDGTLAIHATAAQRAEAFLKTLGLWRP